MNTAVNPSTKLTAWAIVLRRLLYEKDRIDTVDPSATLTLDPKLLERFPVGYRHLAYLQSGLGFDVKRNMPGLKGPEEGEALRITLELAGEALPKQFNIDPKRRYLTGVSMGGHAVWVTLVRRPGFFATSG